MSTGIKNFKKCCYSWIEHWDKKDSITFFNTILIWIKMISNIGLLSINSVGSLCVSGTTMIVVSLISCRVSEARECSILLLLLIDRVSTIKVYFLILSSKRLFHLQLLQHIFSYKYDTLSMEAFLTYWSREKCAYLYAIFKPVNIRECLTTMKFKFF